MVHKGILQFSYGWLVAGIANKFGGCFLAWGHGNRITTKILCATSVPIFLDPGLQRKRAAIFLKKGEIRMFALLYVRNETCK